MSEPGCPRSFEAEALRDGRLSGGERTSFERHLGMCAACSREVAAFDELAVALQSGADREDQVRARRERVRLLAAFDAALVKPEQSSHKTRRFWAAGLAFALAALAGFAWRQQRTPPAPGAKVTVQAQGIAVWSEQTLGSDERVRLDRGSLRLHVDHALGDTHLIVAVPDGEIEDVGTIFVVEVAGDRTTRVTVEEGRVLLRLRGVPARTVHAGETWQAEREAAVASASAMPPTLTPTASSPLPAAPAASAVAMPHVAPLDAAADFRAAMNALGRGDNRQAEQMLAVFLQKHPRDPHAEDAAYARVIALQRCGDTAQMRRAAEQYLDGYPAGFRRAEVATLTR